jgi:oxygen-independent coproporphyrinogen III oxidase
LNRLHTATSALESIQKTYSAGIKNISVDLMYDLPGQTLDIWIDTLQRIVSQPITHLSLYNLTIEPHTSFYKHRKTIQPLLPNEETSLQMFETAIEIFKFHGLEQYEISAFAKNKQYSKHNLGYWTARPFLGLGPSAFSDWEGRRFRNIAHLQKYHTSLKQKESPVDFEEKLDPQARQKELFAIHLRILTGVNLALFEKQHGPLDPQIVQTLEKLQKEGFIQRNGTHFSLTKQGILFHDSVAVEII